MPFPRRFLHDTEDIILDLRPHLWFLAGPLLALAVAVVGGGLLAQNVNPGNGNVNGWFNWLWLLLVLASLAWLGLEYLQWTTTNFVVTTDRLIYRSGVVAKHGKEIPLDRINDITFHQTVFERLIGAGDLMIESGGEHGQQRFSDIRRPFTVQNEIYRAMESGQARDADRMAGRRELSLPEQLEKLDELRQRGVLSQAEFDAKKAQLLERM